MWTRFLFVAGFFVWGCLCWLGVGFFLVLAFIFFFLGWGVWGGFVGGCYVGVGGVSLGVGV